MLTFTISVRRILPSFGRLARYSSSASDNLYQLLGLEATASQEDIKKAFRKAAKSHHPDVAADDCHASRGSHFARILTAYQVLSDPEKRRLYDLESDAGTTRFLRHAARGQRTHEAPPAGRQTMEWAWDWLPNPETMPPPARQHRNQLNRMRAELQVEFREALLHAYRGPRLDMRRMQLPDCFEAEQRSDPAASDILQLVSGRQLLGVVRERSTPLLQGSLDDAGRLFSTQDVQPTIGAGSSGSGSDRSSGSSSSNGSHSDADANSCVSGASATSGSGSEDAGQPAAEEIGSDPARHTRVQRQRAAARGRMLELELEGEVVALGTRRRLPTGKQLLEVHREGQLVYRETGGSIRKHGDTTAKPTHRVVASSTPFVQETFFMALQGVGGLKRDSVVCRCKRAWLPPSATWLFPPRIASHSHGGFYIEWCGHKYSGHQAWLDPAALVLRAAFETLDEEAQQQQQQQQLGGGLWSWLKVKLPRGKAVDG